MTRISKQSANHIVGKLSGVKETDSKVEAAEKVLQTMKDAGFPASAIRKAEGMVAELRRREGKA
jgi:hypothetical protein